MMAMVFDGKAMLWSGSDISFQEHEKQKKHALHLRELHRDLCRDLGLTYTANYPPKPVPRSRYHATMAIPWIIQGIHMGDTPRSITRFHFAVFLRQKRDTYETLKRY